MGMLINYPGVPPPAPPAPLDLETKMIILIIDYKEQHTIAIGVR